MTPHHPPQDPSSVELEGATIVHDRSSLDLTFSDEITLMDDLPVAAADASPPAVIIEDDEAFLTAGLIDDGLTTEDERTDPTPESMERRFLAKNGLQGLAGLDDADEDETLFMSRQLLVVAEVDADEEDETLFMSRKVVARAVFEKPLGTPPALPLPLTRRADEDSWLQRLPAESRQVLETARRPMPEWPKANRVDAAVASPVKRIPSLRA